MGLLRVYDVFGGLESTHSLCQTQAMRRKSNIKFLLEAGAIATFLTCALNEAHAESVRDYTASAVRVMENSATMLEHDVGWITTSSGPVGSDGIPEIIRYGDIITVGDKTVTANIIKVSEILEDMKYRGEVFAHAGDVSCLIASTEADIPRDDDRDRLWIHVKNCELIEP